MDLAVDNPNFSLILPVGCEAKCKFCFWKEKPGLDKVEYFKRVAEVRNQLPQQFESVTITGGEPSLYEGLPIVAGMLSSSFQKVVLATNGTDLSRIYKTISFLTHINLSRHHHFDRNNEAFFGSEGVPSSRQIRHLSEVANRRGVEVSLSCVLSSNSYANLDFINTFVEHAKDMGISKIFFRKLMTSKSTLLPHGLERLLTSDKILESSCKVCRSTTYLIGGMHVIFKASTMEPSQGMGAIYEAILHPDGKLTSDWAGEKEISLEGPESGAKAVSKWRRKGKGKGGGHPGKSPARATKKQNKEVDPAVMNVPIGCGVQSGCA